MKLRRVFHFKFSVLLIATSIWFLPTSFSTQAQAASSENNALLKAVFKGDITKIEILQDKDANSDIQDNEGIRKILLDILLEKEAKRIVEDEKQAEVQGIDSRMSDFKFRDYLQRVDGKIRWQWAPPPITPEKDSLVVRFDIKKDGSIDKISVVVEESSGNPFLDQAALRAVSAANPFSPLPDAYTNDILTFYMHFIVHKETEKTISAGLRDSLLLIATDDGKTKIEKKREMIKAMLTSNIDTGSLLHFYDNILKDLTRRLDSPIPVKLFSHAFYQAKDKLSYKCRKKESNIDPYELLFPIANENIPITQMKHEMRFFLRFYG